ncbi:hypothetical protein OKW50_008322 [Paraburkholderia youngii]|uniref:hypothetical protein n=1 Tax=Paraburkholderia youngii TaxID=2782701 RepID=UPI003D197B4E
MKARFFQQMFIAGLLGLAVNVVGSGYAVAEEKPPAQTHITLDQKAAASAAAKIGASTAARTAMGGVVGGEAGGVAAGVAVTLTPTKTGCGRGETCR